MEKWTKAVVWLFCLAAAVPGAEAGETILPVAEDSWIHGTGSTTPLGGTDTRLGICPVVEYWIYLKFDLGALDCAILGAELRMVRTGGSRPEEISLYPIADDGWSEATLTGVNRPAPTSPVPGTGIASGEERIAEGYDRWTSAALADLVRGESAGDGTLSIMLREDPDTIFDVRYFNSKEAAVAATAKPRLVLETAAAEAAGLALDRGDAVALSWDAAGPLAVYDVIGGPLGQLALDGGTAGAGCLAEDLTDPTYDDMQPNPAPGQGFYYLVRIEDACGNGSYGTDTAGTERLPAAACLP